jgi:predicted histidine transporter YuiF (NhaC family)
MSVKDLYQKTLVVSGMLMAGVSPSMALDSAGLQLKDLQAAKLTNTLKTVQDTAKDSGETALSIILWGAMAMGVAFFFWGAYMAASKDQREEGKAKDGIKLAGLGIIFMGAVTIINSIIGK